MSQTLSRHESGWKWEIQEISSWKDGMPHIIQKLRKKFKNAKECDKLGFELKFIAIKGAKSRGEFLPWKTQTLDDHNFLNTCCIWKNE